MNTETTPIEITVNGEPREVSPELTVSELLAQLDLTLQRVAVEHNLSILSQKHWAETKLQSGDRLEIVHFVGGG
jgi:thiamine biosynthesis protein ThiS